MTVDYPLNGHLQWNAKLLTLYNHSGHTRAYTFTVPTSEQADCRSSWQHVSFSTFRYLALSLPHPSPLLYPVVPIPADSHAGHHLFGYRPGQPGPVAPRKVPKDLMQQVADSLVAEHMKTSGYEWVQECQSTTSTSGYLSRTHARTWPLTTSLTNVSTIDISWGSLYLHTTSHHLLLKLLLTLFATPQGTRSRCSYRKVATNHKHFYRISPFWEL